MDERVTNLHANMELIGSLSVVCGLVAMQVNDPNGFVQTGIYCWTAAQILLVFCWKHRHTNAKAAAWMGCFNLCGSAAFFAGCFLADNGLGMFISTTYILSSLVQFLSGMLRLKPAASIFHQKLLTRLLAQKHLIAVAALQAVGGMGFIVLMPLAGIFFTIAAFMGLALNLLLLQYQLLTSNHRPAQNGHNVEGPVAVRS